MKLGVLDFLPNQIIKWLRLFDLILDGVEINLDQAGAFVSFVSFLKKRVDNFPPLEFHERIVSCLCRGLILHAADETCQTLGNSLLFRFVGQVASITTMAANNTGTDVRISTIFNDGYTSPYGQNHCAPAA
jgi:hypothetical protein